MTYDQYQQIYNAAKAQIADRVSKLQPRAGNNASVNGSGISIEVGGAVEEVEEEETWNYVLFGQVIGSTTISGAFNVGPESAATVYRNGFIQSQSTYFWQQTQLYSFNSDEGEPFSRSYRLKLISASNDDPNPATGFKFPTKVTLELYPSDGNGLPLAPVAEYEFYVGYEGDSRAFFAPTPNTFYTLRVKSIERTA